MNIRILLVIFSLYGSRIFGMNISEKSQEINATQYQYRQTIQSDVPALLELVNNEAIHDNKKIVILPKKFREEALRSAIQKQRFFVAEDKGTIIGYKKLFMVLDESEREDILKNEIRCVNNELNCTFAGYIDDANRLIKDDSVLPDMNYSLPIYTGGDFTRGTHRGYGVNTHLTNFALFSLADKVKQHAYEKNAHYLALLYGVTKENAGDYPGASTDRTASISRSFKAFIQVLENQKKPIALQHRRYGAFMPTFDPESPVLRPLPDEQSIPGFGCILLYQMKDAHE